MSYFLTILAGKCPRCGEGNIFASPLAVVPECPKCGLAVGAADTADGPAFLVIVIVGALVTGGAALVEYAFSPPYWLHAVLWIPLIFFLSIYGLRLCKGWLIAAHYRHAFLEPDDPNAS